MLQGRLIILFIFPLFLPASWAHTIDRNEAWKVLLRNSMAKTYQKDSASKTCGEASLHPGCCDYNLNTCHVVSGSCYCDNLCHMFNDCCCDVPLRTSCNRDLLTTDEPRRNCPVEDPTTVPTPKATPSPPTTCYDLMTTPDGCCEGELCFVEYNSTSPICFCHRGCHNPKNQEKCCDDVKSLGCYPQNCTQAGKSCCTDSNRENCRVELSKTSSCYCDKQCVNDGDCCNDVKQVCNITEDVTMYQVKKLLTVVEQDNSDLYERLAATFWRKYNRRNVDQRKRQKRRM